MGGPPASASGLESEGVRNALCARCAETELFLHPRSLLRFAPATHWTPQAKRYVRVCQSIRTLVREPNPDMQHKHVSQILAMVVHTVFSGKINFSGKLAGKSGS